MKIAIGSDHAGFELKEKLKNYLRKKGHTVEDFGAYSEASVDYPAIAVPLARAIAAKKQDKGILLCGSGVGVTIAANRIKGIRAVNAYDLYTAKQSREHGDANILCLGGRVLTPSKAIEILDAWLSTPFSGDERHSRRIKLLDKITATGRRNKRKTTGK